MASTFKNAVNAAIGTASVDVYTAPALTASTIIGLSLANITVNSITANVTMTRGGTTVSLIKNAPIPAGSCLVLFGGDQKLVLETGNKIAVSASVASAVDVVASLLEIN